MVNAVDFLREVSKFIATDRPDIFTPESALDALGDMMEDMRKHGEEASWTSFASFILYRFVEDGVEEWFFSRKIASMAIFEEEEEANVFGWTNNSGTLRVGIDLPGPS